MLEFAKVTAVRLGTRVRAVLAQLRAAGDEGDDDGAEGFDECEVVHPLGFVSLPATPLARTLEAAFVRDGDEGHVLALVDKALGVLGSGVNALAAGAAKVFAPGNLNARVDWLPSGDVVINGGLLRIARVTDPVNICTIQASAVIYPCTLIITPINADGSPGTPTTSVYPALATIHGFVSSQAGSGAEHGLA
jgi:hypothetical protein